MTFELLLQGRNILIVEDQYAIAAELSRALQARGARVIGPFGRLAEAWAVAMDTSLHIDAAVLDVNLHNEEVLPVAEALKRRRIPFVIASGYEASALPAAYLAAPRLEKPVDVAVLANLLADLLARHAEDQAFMGDFAAR